MNLTKPETRRGLKPLPTAYEHARALLDGVKAGAVDATAVEITDALELLGDVEPGYPVQIWSAWPARGV
ncbi:hypothetical protein [Roseateles sp.]|uniref:hypothetical protein n=1 Tax=Roseateles sp. TaxID=1971397 RepID=UPI002E03B490|nr:hypothetical protein [Roseateles sp.]